MNAILTEAEKIEVRRARNFAIVAHGKQLYGKHPYVYHLDQVAANASRYHNINIDANLVEFMQAAYLHDIIEDTDNTDITDIEDVFGYRVRYLVASLTRYSGETYREYLKSVRSKYGPRILKLADVMANLNESFIINNEKLIKKYVNAVRILTFDIID